MARSGSEDGDLVLAVRAGEEAAFAELVDRWLDRCWEVAWRILRDRDLAADVAQETLTTAWERLATLDRPESFGGWVLRIARNRALNRLERERRTVSTADDHALEPTDRLVAPDGPDDTVERDDRAALLWAAAAALGPRDASVLDLHLRHGMGPVELAEALEVTANNAHQLLFRLRTRLGGAIRAHVLWNDGDPRCQDLAAALGAAGVTTFGPAAVRTISRHADGCTACEDDRTAVLAPTALFGAVPLLAMPAGLRDGVLLRLGGDGVPVPAGATAADGPGHADGPAPTDTPGDPAGPSADRGADDPSAADPDRSRRRVAAAIAAAVLALVVTAGLVAGAGDRSSDTVATAAAPADAVDATTTTAATTVTGAPDAATDPPPSPAPPDPPEPAPSPAVEVPGEASGAPAPAGGPVGPGPADPADAPPAPAPPMAPRPPTTAPPAAPTTTPPAAPTADLQVADDPAACSLGRRITWATTGATTVTLSVGGGAPAPVATSGSTTVCAHGQPVVLTASGPGGTTVAETTT